MLIEGKNAVGEAVQGTVTIEKLCVQKGFFSDAINRIVAAARARKIKIVFSEKATMDSLSVTGYHQGIIAIATEFNYTELDDLIRDTRATGKPMLFVLLDGVEDPHNVGAIVRVVDCAGASGIILPKHRSCGITDTAIKVSSGAAAHVPVAKVTNINDAIRTLKNEGVFVYACDMSGHSVYQANLTGDIAIIIGGEGDGVHELTRKLADGVISLPQLGKVNSLNASVAAGAVLYESVRQRLEVAK